MFEEDRAPVALTETHQDTASFQRSFELADRCRCRSTFEQFLRFEHYSDIAVTIDSTSNKIIRSGVIEARRTIVGLLNPMRTGVLSARCC